MKNLETTKQKSYKEAVINIGVINEFRVYYNYMIRTYNYTHRLFDEDAIKFKTNADIEADLSKATPEDINKVRDLIKPIYDKYLDELYRDVFPTMKVVLGYDIDEE